MERAVEFISLNHRVGAGGAEQQVAVVVAQDSSQKGVAANFRAVQNVSCHARSSGLAVRTRKTQSLGASGDKSEQLGTLHHGETAIAEVVESLVRSRDSRSIYHQSVGRVLAIVGNEGGSLIKAYFHALAHKGIGELCAGEVVARHAEAAGKEIALQGSHTDAACTHKIY